jgi:hypothetical protein
MSRTVVVALCVSIAAAAATVAVGVSVSSAQSTAPATPGKKIVIPPKPKPGAPHGPGFDMPLIEMGGYAPPRPMNVLRDAHIFAADHPEVSSYIPCYCGCGNQGHRDNADCFVKSRDAQGRVTAWDGHGVSCAVCIDVAVHSMRMYNSGASVSAIRAAIEKAYQNAPPGAMTPTPRPPAAAR